MISVLLCLSFHQRYPALRERTGWTTLPT